MASTTADPDMAEPVSSSPVYLPPNIPSAESDTEPDWMDPPPRLKRRELYSSGVSASRPLAERHARRKAAQLSSTSSLPSGPVTDNAAGSTDSRKSPSPNPPPSNRQTTMSSTASQIPGCVNSFPSPEPQPSTPSNNDSDNEASGAALAEAFYDTDTWSNERQSLLDDTAITTPDETMEEQAEQTQKSMSIPPASEMTIITTAKSQASDQDQSATVWEEDDDKTYPYNKVIAVWNGYCVIDWAGTDPNTGLPWKPSLQPKKDFTGEVPTLDATPDKVVEAKRAADVADKDCGEDDEDDGQDKDDGFDETYNVRSILDSVTFPSMAKNKTFTLYLVDWEPGKGGREIYESEWVANQDISAEAVEQYRTKQGQTELKKNRTAGNKRKR